MFLSCLIDFDEEERVGELCVEDKLVPVHHISASGSFLENSARKVPGMNDKFFWGLMERNLGINRISTWPSRTPSSAASS